MDDFPTCLKENKIVCRIHFDIVTPNSTSNNAWNIIQKSTYGSIQYRKDKLKRFRCLSNSFLGKEDDIANSLLANENELLRNYSLEANIEELQCRSYQDTNLTSFDYAVLFGTIGLLATVLVATIVDVWLDATEVSSEETAIKYVQYFSMVSNWKILTRPSKSIDRHKLKGMQGMRVLGTIYVINGHTIFTVLIHFVKNTRFIEEFGNAAHIGIVLGMYIVQISFLISGWLLANSIYKYVAKTGRLMVKDVIMLTVYRYLSNLLYVKGSLPFNFMEMQRSACKKNWWRSFFLINNFSKGSDHCNAALWSLANDFQMYLISVCLFYIIFKYKKSLMLFVYMSGIFCGIHGYEITDIDAVEIFKTDEFYVMYAALYVNFGSYAIGVLFGSVHYEYKNLKIENSLTIGLWLLLVAVFIYYRFYSILWLLKVCINFAGFARRIFESDFIQLIANWQYNQEYAQIPPLHDMDDLSTCLGENRISKKSDISQFRKDKLKRFRCLPKSFLGKEEEIANSVVTTENELLKNYSLQVDIKELYCRSYSDVKLTSFDFGVLLGTIGLLVILISATTVKYIRCFSFMSNWKALITSTSKDGQKLKAMQGIRVLSTMYIIHIHISLTLAIYLMKNPRFIEKVCYGLL
nr:unnamed protein product [Callosobruchus chinensis]